MAALPAKLILKEQMILIGTAARAGNHAVRPPELCKVIVRSSRIAEQSSRFEK